MKSIGGTGCTTLTAITCALHGLLPAPSLIVGCARLCRGFGVYNKNKSNREIHTSHQVAVVVALVLSAGPATDDDRVCDLMYNVSSIELSRVLPRFCGAAIEISVLDTFFKLISSNVWFQPLIHSLD